MKNTRRDFLKQIGYVSIGFSLVGPFGFAAGGEYGQPLQRTLDKNKVDAWLQLLEDGRIRIYTGKIELGQGITIAVKQMAAEELDTDLSLIEVAIAETGVTPNEGFTAGSQSIESSAMAIRNAAAFAREAVLQIASEKWSIPTTQLKLKNAKIFGPDKEVSLYQLLEGRQIEKTIHEVQQYRGKSIRKYVGRPIPREDIEAMVRGRQVFVQDLRFKNMLHARVVHPPSYRSTLVYFDSSEIKKLPGLIKLIRKGNFLGVLAAQEYEAIRIMEQVKGFVRWDSSRGDQLPAGKDLEEYIKMLPVETETNENIGSPETVLQQSTSKVKASFFKPYLMHAANGPSCAIALFEEGKLHVWSHCQGAYPLRGTLAKLLGMPEESVHVKGVPGAGCFGHNGANDVAAEAALMALEYPGRHIRLQWMRDDENGWEPYGTAMAVELEAALDNSGTIAAWQCDVWSDGHSNRPNGNPNTLLPAYFLEEEYGHPGIGYRGGAYRNTVPYYKIPNITVRSHMFQGPLRASSLRSLGTYTNIFAIESLMDELAEKAQKNPLEFRLSHALDQRSVDCMQQLKTMVKGVSKERDEGLGFAFSRYKNSASYCAMAALISVNTDSGKVRVKKMWAVVDSGETINPDGLKNQTEGGMIQSASWALKEEVKFDAEHITSLDWNSYPILRFPDTPEVQVEVIDRVDQPPVGAGEATQAPATAAIVNAIFDATGIRIRRLPVDPELLKAR
ncbi:xanthine dehydrogenase family protein molybdopterin-binding subunit [Pareuzebyella sediminis]|uniref:xanthine dehydrogenase family protein molybdopterin-binding subunit n=1 Tax=Pareuzebyella sediminis TaxID=2607998 RepID=UPI0011EF28A9|nr:molybdopterin cofactor-binding domain-containing protein [Pareuzebyella sediminis]